MKPCAPSNSPLNFRGALAVGMVADQQHPATSTATHAARKAQLKRQTVREFFIKPAL